MPILTYRFKILNWKITQHNSKPSSSKNHETTKICRIKKTLKLFWSPTNLNIFSSKRFFILELCVHSWELFLVYSQIMKCPSIHCQESNNSSHQFPRNWSTDIPLWWRNQWDGCKTNVDISANCRSKKKEINGKFADRIDIYPLSASSRNPRIACTIIVNYTAWRAGL